jgi:hypothetical protein
MLARRTLLLAALAAPAAAFAQTTFVASGAAIRGYDPVAYFTMSRPVQGSREFTHRWNGAEWRFANAQHRDQFAADPERYAPQYGGFCAYAVAQGYRADIDPTAWRIVDGRLYLNYSASVQRTWEANMSNFIRSADGNWPRLRGQ